MKRMFSFSFVLVRSLSLALFVGLASLPVSSSNAAPAVVLEGTTELNMPGDLSSNMVDGIRRFLLRQIDQTAATRPGLWKRDLSSPEAYSNSIAANRERLARAIGAVDPRLPIQGLEYLGSTEQSSKVAETDGCILLNVRWPVLEGVHGEGLLLQPKSPAKAAVIVIPDADQTPESVAGLDPLTPTDRQYARRLAESGCMVIVPLLIDRSDTFSGNPALRRFTNQPHREWIYRQAFEMGRHVVGYEVQKIRSLLDWLSGFQKQRGLRVGVFGYGEGGLIALHTAALDTRVDACMVSGYFGPRSRVWEEPIYRNIWGILEEFADAELAAMVAPRAMLVEAVAGPTISGPPKSGNGRSGAAPGKLSPVPVTEVQAETQRSSVLVPQIAGKPWGITLVIPEKLDGPPGTDPALKELLAALNISTLSAPGKPVHTRALLADVLAARQQRQVRELERHCQNLLLISERTRQQFFWDKSRPSTNWVQQIAPFKDRFWNDVIGRLPAGDLPANPRTRLVEANARWASYDVVLDVWQDVFAWGLLLIPSDLKPGERRPVVVCQHGLEGVPQDTVNRPGQPGHEYYKSFSAKLAERGFIVFAPHNPYRGQDRFRVLQRMANPLRKSLFSIITGQHDRIIDWLETLPYVDKSRIAFYGLSYGGKTAVRVPALLDRYCLSICSADYNDWIKKNVTVESGYSYMYTGEYELPEFDLGNTFNYAEMSALIAPRPFMVERGHDDGVAPDEWVAHEFAKVRRLYAKLGIPGNTDIEFFNGPHTINGRGTYEFLHKHLRWPAPR